MSDLFSLETCSCSLTKLENIYCRTRHNLSAVKIVQIYHSQMGVVVYCYLALFDHGRSYFADMCGSVDVSLSGN